MTNFNRLKQLDRPAPIAPRITHSSEHHGQTLSDPYFWLKDQGYPEVDDVDVLDYLKAENDYFADFLKPHTKLVDTIFEEFKGRTDEKEESVPYDSNGYRYRWFYKEGAEYKTHSRTKLGTNQETIFLDENSLAEGHDYFDLESWDISSDNRYLAYSFDTSGEERFQVRFVDLQTGLLLDDQLDNTNGDIEFAADPTTILYALLEQDRWLAKNIKVHKLGTAQDTDKTIYYEEDDGFSIGFGKTSSKEFFILSASQGEAQESYALATSDPYAEPVLLVSRDKKFEQSIDHAHGQFYILANDTHKNFRLASVKDNAPQHENWQTIEAGSDDIFRLDLQTFDSGLVLKSRNQGFEKLEVREYGGSSRSVDFPEQLFSISLGNNPEFSQSFVRLDYESMITPDTVYDYGFESNSLVLRKVKKIPSGYEKSNYQTERIMAPARDGTLIPVSLVYRKDFKKDGSQPLHLYGYGAYGVTVTPRFSSNQLSLLDRGFAFAVAHVRGGSMMSYQWYLDGKLKKRTNTFNDFIDVARFLVSEDYVSTGNISISGRSAGGELMGAAVIQAPELWRSVTLGVPFVDVVNTMLDASLPLTPPEWEEWGNPIEDAEAFRLLLSYSPYDNIEAREYPPMMVTGGLNDPRVTYWEPAKWTAKMRHLKTDENLLVMRMNMGAGHFANSGRYGRLRDYAEEYAFMLLAHGIGE